jgi:ATPase subunit of ABC transporter with duplicated ATPase domains
VVNTRASQALEVAATNLPIHRTLRCAARGKLERLFDDLALKLGLIAQRLEEGTLLLEGPGVFVHADGKTKSDYCERRIRSPMFIVLILLGPPGSGKTRLVRTILGEMPPDREQSAFARTFPAGTKSCSVASIYRVFGSVTA